jgi:hypothetical protein
MVQGSSVIRLRMLRACVMSESTMYRVTLGLCFSSMYPRATPSKAATSVCRVSDRIHMESNVFCDARQLADGALHDGFVVRCQQNIVPKNGILLRITLPTLRKLGEEFFRRAHAHGKSFTVAGRTPVVCQKMQLSDVVPIENLPTHSAAIRVQADFHHVVQRPHAPVPILPRQVKVLQRRIRLVSIPASVLQWLIKSLDKPLEKPLAEVQTSLIVSANIKFDAYLGGWVCGCFFRHFQKLWTRIQLASPES